MLRWRCFAVAQNGPDFLSGIPGLTSPWPYEIKLSACIAGPTMAMIALKCPSIQVAVVDLNQQRIDAWNSECLPIYEPGLHEVVKACRGRNLIFSTDCRRHVAEADIIFVRCTRIPCPGCQHEPQGNNTNGLHQNTLYAVSDILRLAVQREYAHQDDWRGCWQGSRPGILGGRCPHDCFSVYHIQNHCGEEHGTCEDSGGHWKGGAHISDRTLRG